MTKNYFIAFCGVAGVTIGLWPLGALVNSTSVALAFLLVVLVVAAMYGSRPALFASIVAALSFNFFFLPPLYTFAIAESQNWAALAAFLATAIIAGQLSSYARRRAEESEARRQEITRLYDELKSAFEHASQAEAFRRGEKLKSALLDAVTHDLRTPLTSIKAAATTLMEESIAFDRESRNELLEIINEETDRLNSFIGDMVDMAKIETGRTQAHKTWHDVRSIVEQAMKRAAPRLADHPAQIALEDDLPLIRVDAHAVESILYALLENASKYSPAGADIRISASRAAGETLEICVEDKGCGIAPDARERIFDKFFRASDNDIHSTADGLGLGLAIARGIAESQGANLRAAVGRDGFVTRFVFQIPVGDNE